LIYWVFGFGLGLSIPWAGIVLYFGFPLFGFGYYDRNPVKWEELDMEQKWWYGQGIVRGEAPKGYQFTASQAKEWQELNKYFKNKFRLQ
jgi:hypothetical protein